jgi:Protein of unknown function (DUF3619)
VTRRPITAASAAAPALEARFAYRVAAMLSERSDALPHDLEERLKFARQQAVQRMKSARVLAQADAAQASGGSLALLGGSGVPLWWRLVSVLPLVALVVGLVLIQDDHLQTQIEAAADVDAALLGDDPPPSAYDDPGFVEFLKTPRNN